MSLQEYMSKAETVGNLNIFDSFIKADNIINKPQYNTILCSISGGSDSDIMLDLIHKVDRDKKVIYVWIDTGLEYMATKEHLNYLEKKYNIKIHREKAIKPIPMSALEYGQPFLNKYVSDQIMRLQKHNFNWEDKPYKELIKKYPKCKGALKWWCNYYEMKKGYNSRFNISRNKYLKEFIIANPPSFKISSKCCTYAKKNVGNELGKKYNSDLQIIGVRRDEGGIRATAYKNCFSNNQDKEDQYRPLFWYSDKDKVVYEELFDIKHSACYTDYGMTRTGCAGCPYSRKLTDELSVIEKFEPKLLKGVNKIFKDSYAYTKKYRIFYQIMKEKEKQLDGQLTLLDYE